MFDLFTLGGIRYKAEFSVIFILLLASSGSHYGVSSGMTFVAILLVILLHELGHAGAAKMFKAHVEAIVIGFGGRTIYTGQLTPWQKFMVSVAGPLANLATIPLMMVLLPEAGFGQIVILWSLILGLFNLMPMLPLDGGHLVQHAVEAGSNSHHARVVALKVTRATAVVTLVVCLFGGGVLPVDPFFLGILAGIFGFMAHRELKVIGSYSSGAGLWQKFQQQREQKKQETKREQTLETKNRVDQLLGKISREGMSSLTAEEREFLKNASDSFKS